MRIFRIQPLKRSASIAIFLGLFSLFMLRAYYEPQPVSGQRELIFLNGSWTSAQSSSDAREDLFQKAVMNMPSPSKSLSRNSFEGNFDAFFHHRTNSTFLDHYNAVCRIRLNQGSSPKRLVALYNLSADFGFGSVLNSFVNVYAMAQDPSVDRVFHIFEIPATLGYTLLSRSFDDFAQNSECPVFRTLRTNDTDLSVPWQGAQFQTDSGSLSLMNSERAMFLYELDGDVWQNYIRVQKALEKSYTTEKLFAVKSPFTQALWHLKPHLKQLLKAIWTQFTHESRGQFMAIHIRRSDKIERYEMKDIAIVDYLAELRAICRSLNGTCSRKIFVMYDDAVAYRRLTALTGVEFSYFELSDLLSGSEFDGVRRYILGGKRGGDELSWERHSRELILSLTLMSMADHVVCTFSSNLCRLAALINGNLTAFHSLDKAWFGQ